MVKKADVTFRRTKTGLIAVGEQSNVIKKSKSKSKMIKQQDIDDIEALEKRQKERDKK